MDIILTHGTPSRKSRVAINFYDNINAEASSHQILATKMEITLQKVKCTSWPALELGTKATTVITFGLEKEKRGTVNAGPSYLSP